MFKKAILKLTAIYFVFLFSICVFFSVVVYGVASRQIEKANDRQRNTVRKLTQENLRMPPGELLGPKEEQLKEDRRILMTNLIMANLLIITIGLIGCYVLARKTLEPIEEAHEAQKRFTADASHELRTPLAVMQSEIEVAMMENLSKVSTNKLLASNLEEIARLQLLSEQLLQLSKGDDDNNIETEELNIDELMNKTINRLKKAYKNADIEYNNNSDKSSRIFANAELIQQVLHILIDNAVKYCDKKPQITVTLKQHKSNYQIVVKDNGVGINQTNINHIFDRFYRADSSRTKNKSTGYGLGLSLAKQIVKSHGGDISVKSTVGKGSAFTINLPA